MEQTFPTIRARNSRVRGVIGPQMLPKLYEHHPGTPRTPVLLQNWTSTRDTPQPLNEPATANLGMPRPPKMVIRPQVTLTNFQRIKMLNHHLKVTPNVCISSYCTVGPNRLNFLLRGAMVGLRKDRPPPNSRFYIVHAGFVTF